MKFKIGRKTWVIGKGETLPDELGFCCWDDQRIVLRRRLTRRQHLDVTVHELIHATQPEMTEKEVLRLEAILTGILWRAGYRRRR